MSCLLLVDCTMVLNLTTDYRLTSGYLSPRQYTLSLHLESIHTDGLVGRILEEREGGKENKGRRATDRKGEKKVDHTSLKLLHLPY